MKFNTINRTAKAVVMSLALGLGTVACSRDFTADYVYAVSNSTGLVSAFAVDFQTGILDQIPGSPFISNLTNPSSIVAAPNGKTVYVIGGNQNAQVSAMTVGTDGKLFAQTGGGLFGQATSPTAAAVDPSGSFLYVTYTFEGGFSTASPGPGGISIFPINANGTLGTPTNVNVGISPVAIAISTPVCNSTASAAAGSTSNAPCNTLGSSTTSNNGVDGVFVYVVDADPKLPTVLGFAENTTTGALTPLPGTNANGGWNAGVAPSAIAIDPTGKFVYITDEQQNEVFGYQITNSSTSAPGTDGGLTSLQTSPFPTGGFPMGITIEPRGKFVYVANFNSATVSSYSLNQANGSLTASAGSTFSTQTGPTCVTVDPALGIYLYTSDFLNQSVSGGQLSPDTGQLTAVANSFFPTGIQPICLTSVPNGAHASQIDNQ